MEANTEPKLHLYVLLDRSGSMSSMIDAVIEGFNTLLAEQAAEGPGAWMTFVQFDGQNPQETLADAIPIAEVAPLTAQTFVPRGNTPLLDATGLLLGKAIVRANGVGDAEHVVFAAITDGEENASTEFSLEAIRKTIEQRTAAGWTFVFLGADPSAYAEAGGLGVDQRSTQQWTADSAGARVAMSELSRGVRARRMKIRDGESYDAGDFFEGTKAADDDRGSRGGRRTS
jgi:Mg-chelatase subunit ChlD